jgi:hypothetical protein
MYSIPQITEVAIGYHMCDQAIPTEEEDLKPVATLDTYIQSRQRTVQEYFRVKISLSNL